MSVADKNIISKILFTWASQEGILGEIGRLVLSRMLQDFAMNLKSLSLDWMKAKAVTS